jgi:hypothetical protein
MAPAAASHVSEAERQGILDLVHDLPAVWQAETTTHAERKQVVRLLIKPKFLPLKKRILLKLLRLLGNYISVYWEHHPQELERPLLEGCGLCELTERQPIQARCHATTMTTTGPEGSQKGREAVDGQAIDGEPARLFLSGGR